VPPLFTIYSFPIFFDFSIFRFFDVLTVFVFCLWRFVDCRLAFFNCYEINQASLSCNTVRQLWHYTTIAENTISKNAVQYGYYFSFIRCVKISKSQSSKFKVHRVSKFERKQVWSLSEWVSEWVSERMIEWLNDWLPRDLFAFRLSIYDFFDFFDFCFLLFANFSNFRIFNLWHIQLNSETLNFLQI